jgi:single-strand binding protein
LELALEGKLVNNTYETKEGEKRYTTEIEMREFIVLSKEKQVAENKSNKIRKL